MNWDDVREFISSEPGVAYLNTGSYGLVPKPVFEAATEFRRRLAAEPADFLWRHVPELLWTARRRLAEFLGGTAERLVLTANVTAAINTVADGLPLEAGSEVLVTDHVYPAMRFVWEHYAQQRGWEVRTLKLPVLPADGSEIVACFEQSLSTKTRAVFFSHVLYTTGLVLPAREICALARRRGIVSVVDGAHAPGMLPLDLAGIDADYYCGNCHKWLLVPMGTGFLHFGAGREDTLGPLVVSWGYHSDTADRLARDQWGSTPAVRFHEFQGTRDPSPWLSVPATLDFRRAIGGEGAIRARIAELADAAREILAPTGWQLRTPPDRTLRGGITALAVPEQAPQELAPLLWERFRIEVPVVEYADGRLLRVSTHFYNTPEEIERLTSAIGELGS